MVLEYEKCGKALKVHVNNDHFYFIDKDAKKFIERLDRSYITTHQSYGSSAFIYHNGDNRLLAEVYYAARAGKGKVYVRFKNCNAFDLRFSNLAERQKFDRNCLMRRYFLKGDGHFVIMGHKGTDERSRTFVSEDLAAAFAYERYKDDTYNFLEDMSHDTDLLEKELRGKISHEEAVRQHVIRHASNNAWLYIRCGLEGYFKEHNIPKPKYTLNTDLMMVDSEGRLLSYLY